MILSVSRRTDIPNYYSEWFYNRIKEGFLYVRNPMNVHQISEIKITPDVVDCIVFWTKNPLPMMERLDELKAYHYYFQFTLTGYGNDAALIVMQMKVRRAWRGTRQSMIPRPRFCVVMWKRGTDYSGDCQCFFRPAEKRCV